MVWSLFIIDLMGLFFYTKIGSIISIGDLPTTNIIEPKKGGSALFLFLKLLSAHHSKSKESKFTFYLPFFLALISYMCYSCDSDYKIKGACYEKSSFIRRN